MYYLDQTCVSYQVYTGHVKYVQSARQALFLNIDP